MERANGDLGTSLLPGRQFASPADFNTQLGDWLTGKANLRRHAITGTVLAQGLIVDRAAMAALPPMAPTVGTTTNTRLGRHYRQTGRDGSRQAHRRAGRDRPPPMGIGQDDQAAGHHRSRLAGHGKTTRALGEPLREREAAGRADQALMG